MAIDAKTWKPEKNAGPASALRNWATVLGPELGGYDKHGNLWIAPVVATALINCLFDAAERIDELELGNG